MSSINKETKPNISSIVLYYPIKYLPEPFQSMATINGTKPFKPIVTQNFGENGAPFYKQLGMLGHNGIDYVAPDGVNVYAAHAGNVFKTYDKENSSETIGYGVWIKHKEGWWTVYFHLKDVAVKVGENVNAGELIGRADNTGKYTTGSHLHFGLYPANREEIRDNGFDGAISPTLYFKPNKMTKEKLTEIYHDLLFRDPDELAEDYLAYDEEFVRKQVRHSEERERIAVLVEKARNL